IGRTDELERITALLDSESDSATPVVLIGGEAGVGKSRIVSAVSDRAAASGRLVLDGRCTDLGAGSLPFEPFASVIRELVQASGAERVMAAAGPRVADLATVVPEL